MSTSIQRRRGTTAQHSSFTGANGEITIDTDKEVVVVHDGATAGGYPAMRENGSNSALALGSAATPSLKFTGDTNTGLYSPGADQVAISTNGTGRLFVDASGRITNVGTGLQVNYGGYSDVTFADPGSGNNIYLLTYTPGGAFFLGSNNGATFNYGWGSSSTGHIWHTGSGNERMRLDASGRLGLGSSAPQGLLHVEGVTGNAPVRIVGSSGNSSALALYNNAATTNRFVVGQGFSSGSDNVAFIQNDANAAMVFGTNAQERLRITSDGRLGLGTSSPATTLDVNGDVTITDKIIHGGDTNTAIRFPAADTVSVETNGSERARIDSSGRLLVGTSTSINVGTLVGTTQQIAGSGQPLSLRRFSNSTVGPNILFGKTRATVDADYTIVQDGDTLGGLIFAGADGVDLETQGATIVAQVDGTPGTNDMPGRLVFSTTSDGSASPSERARITNDGYLRLAGKGIQFNGDTADANSLDDYEEGTFTPVVVGGTTAGTATYSTQVGRYTKIGRTVTVEVHLNWTGGTGAGNLGIEGLPFNPAVYTPLTVGILSNLALTASNYVFAYANANSGTVALQQTPVGGGNRSAITYDASAEIAIAGTYTV